MKIQSNPFVRAAAISAAFTLGINSARAAIYTWDGGAASTNWSEADNWNPNATQAPLGVTAAHRLNINSAQKVVYNHAGITNYTGDTSATGGGRALVIANGNNARGEMEITSGTFSANNARAGDVIGNGNGAIATLTINGGSFIGSSHSAGTSLGLGGGPTCTFNIIYSPVMPRFPP